MNKLHSMDLLPWSAFRRLTTLMAGAVNLYLGAGCGILPSDFVAPGSECFVNADCDDDVFCNGEEYCSIDENDVMRCYDRENPCMNPVGCNEETDTCELDPAPPGPQKNVP